MHLVATIDTGNRDTWKAGRDAHAEERSILRQQADVTARLECYRADRRLSALENGAPAWFQVMQDRLLTSARIAELTQAETPHTGETDQDAD